ncbi:MAG: PolC-type DNA polymerase III [Mycoplasmatales bacterium]
MNTVELFEKCGVTYDDTQVLIFKNVDVNKYSNTWTINLKSDKIISPTYYQHIVKKFNSSNISEGKKILFNIEASNQELDKEQFKEYLKIFIGEDKERLNAHRNLNLKLENNNVVYTIINDNDIKLFSEIKEDLKSFLNEIGLVNFSFKENKLDQKEILKNIKPVKKVKKVVPRDVVIWGDNNLQNKSIPIYDANNPNIPLKIVTVEGTIFNSEVREINANSTLLTFIVHDDEGNTIHCQFFKGYSDRVPTVEQLYSIKDGMFVKVTGERTYVKFNINDEVIKIKSLSKLVSNKTNLEDNHETKRVELHTHTKMSKNNGISSITDYIKRAEQFGQKALAITDHASVQGYVEAEACSKNSDVKMIYGIEANVIQEPVLVYDANDDRLDSLTYTVFDVESTGLSANFNKLIEIGASKIRNGQIVDSYQAFVNIDEPLSTFTTEFTGITDQDLKNGKEVSVVLKEFLEFSKDSVLVAHNAEFDRDFLIANLKEYLDLELELPVIDTLDLSRFLNKDKTYHTLKIVSKIYGVMLDSNSHHRADYDAEILAQIFLGMLRQLKDLETNTLNDINNLNDVNKTRPKHALLYVKNQNGLKSMYELVSASNIKHYHLEPRMLDKDIESKRENLIYVASGCINSDVIYAYLNKPYNILKDTISKYDYIELQSPNQYFELISNDTFKNINDIYTMQKKLYNLATEVGVKVIGSNNMHFINKNQYTSKEILLLKDLRADKVKIDKEGIETFPDLQKSKDLIELKEAKYKDQYYKTTETLLEDFKYLEKGVNEEIVIKNTNLLADSIEDVNIIPDKLFTPEIHGVDDKLLELVNSFAKNTYGEELPPLIKERLDKELNAIIKYGFGVIYYISYKLVKHSLDAGYLVGSRGSVGSSLVATFMNITEINPLPPHYVCPGCKTTEFITDGSYQSGYDLPIKECPTCNVELIRDGQDIPFETFLGFEGDKVPDIDLNFSGDFQQEAFEFVRSKERLGDDELFDYNHAFRAGTIGTIAEKTAYAYARNYFELKGKEAKKSDIILAAKDLEGIKRTTGQHPGGIIVVPNNLDINDFTAVGYPAEDVTQPWQTTHFDFHAIHDNLLKLDILGHDDPTMLKKLKDSTGVDPKTVNITDPKVMELFVSTSSLGVSKDEINTDLGTNGVPEFGTEFVKDMLRDTKPKTYAELVQISGLSHGTNVWLGNSKELIDNNICELKDVIGCRDDIMVYLMHKGMESFRAFSIMENVRKGKGLKEDEIKDMKDLGVPEWYINSCQRIEYMFPKAHAAAYVLMALRIAYYKVYYPIEYYQAYFSSRVSNFDPNTMLQGVDAIKTKINILNQNDNEFSDVKKKNMLNCLEMSLEMVQRGFSFTKYSLEKSQAYEFLISDDKKSLIMPFYAIDGLGDVEAKSIVAERNNGSFRTIKDFKERVRLKKKSFEELELHDVFDGLDEDDQIKLF